MINWTKERAAVGKNYCGWCIGSPPSANCDGSCFKDSKENRIDHLETERTAIQERGQAIEQELKKLLNNG